MRPNGLWASLLIVVAVVGCGVAALVALFHFTDSNFVLSIFGIAAAIITASIQYRAAKDKETDARLFTDKREVYSQLVSTLMNLFHENKTDPTKEDQEALVQKLRGIRTQLLVWGSAATLRALDSLSAGLEPEASGLPISGTKWMAELFGAIRTDLGHKDPPGAALEMALGMLNEPDRSTLRAAIKAKA
ncbi:MAG: hypothetical protein WAU68_17380 [Vitreimonas sp.]